MYIADGEAVYPVLEAQRPAIEAACGLALEWEPNESRSIVTSSDLPGSG